jgi:hypothetical protein
MRHILKSSILLSSLLLPAAAFASQPVDDVSASTRRVSTGVTAPRVIESADVVFPEGLRASFLPSYASFGIALTVDEKGQPQNIHVTRGFNSYWDARVVEAVGKFHFRPGSIDNQPTPVDLNLTVTVTR